MTSEFLLNSIKDTKKAIKARSKIRRKIMFERKIMEIKRAIRRKMEIEIEFESIELTLTLKECILMLFKALFILEAAWAIISGLIIILP